MTDTIAGRCLCGKIAYTISTRPVVTGHCYCVDCRKSSGTGHCTHALVADDAVRIEGKLKFYDHPADSGNIVSRGFCADCGCPILSKNSGMPGMTALRTSSLDDPDMVSPQMAVYTSKAPAWDRPDPSLTIFPLGPDGGEAAFVNQQFGKSG